MVPEWLGRRPRPVTLVWLRQSLSSENQNVFFTALALESGRLLLAESDCYVKVKYGQETSFNMVGDSVGR